MYIYWIILLATPLLPLIIQVWLHPYSYGELAKWELTMNIGNEESVSATAVEITHLKFLFNKFL